MNMTGYQNFVKIFETLKSVHQRQPSLDKIDKNISDKARMNREVDLYLQTCQVFELDDKHKFLLMLTKNPKRENKDLYDMIRLTFPEIFLDVEFDPDDYEGEERVTGVLIREMKNIHLVTDKEKKEAKSVNLYGLDVYVAGAKSDGSLFMDCHKFPIVSSDEEKTKFGMKHNVLSKFIQQFVINFILFLKDREVVYVERKRDFKSQERRKREGKLVLPSSKIVKLEGQLKHYVDSLRESDFKGKLSYRFWVSGTWRYYRSMRYSAFRRSHAQWIEPFKKGQGFEVKHIYRVMPDEEKDTLNFDDIEPAKESTIGRLRK
jgi:hypothetical protein